MITPYSLSKSENDLIDEYLINDKDWGHEELAYIRSNMRRHLSRKQMRCCAFCGIKINIAITDTHLEHIIPKEKFDDFTYEPRNIVLSCPSCNLAKGQKNPLVRLPFVSKIKNGTLVFPDDKDDYLIYHPVYEEYFDHLELFNQLFICSKSKKGDKTIEYYKLDRIEIAMFYAEKLYIDESDMFNKLTDLIYKTTDIELIKKIQDKLDSLLCSIDDMYFEC